MSSDAELLGNLDYRRITSQAVHTDVPHSIDRCILGSKAVDRYHRYRIGARRALRSVGPGEDIAQYPREYGIDLGRGAVIMLHEEKGKPVIRVEHIAYFGVPGFTPEHLLHEDEAPIPITHIDWLDTHRPPADMVRLAARSLGPLPDDLVDSLLPMPLSTGGDAYALATRIFANWLGGNKLTDEATGPSGGEKQQREKATATGTSGGGWLSYLSGLWSRWWRQGESAEAGGGASGGAEVKAKAERAAAAAEPAGSLAAAWDEFERRVRAREPTYNDELEREWFELFLLRDNGGYGVSKGHAHTVELNEKGQDITHITHGH
ncbi:hypothetical protein GPECTOR_110g241 [Gonium pectorale]|uniref:Uncharacterized protein n=1 Tax=Gonium pectorale TaxID=33097 RepID=A0A150FZD2_GONPE|nr:hypothetical protein GPECTOR_110g241 [Gonium pectorale]|eukprot:KXZ42948.1 hypothetical protein GPECTOR_110g241 [Gonium pectorale]